jgi:hypothetical protein
VLHEKNNESVKKLLCTCDIRGTVFSVYTTEKKRVEEKRGEFLCPLSWSVHYNFARDGYIESTVLLCPSKNFSHGNKNTLSLVIVY